MGDGGFGGSNASSGVLIAWAKCRTSSVGGKSSSGASLFKIGGVDRSPNMTAAVDDDHMGLALDRSSTDARSGKSLIRLN